MVVLTGDCNDFLKVPQVPIQQPARDHERGFAFFIHLALGRGAEQHSQNTFTILHDNLRHCTLPHCLAGQPLHHAPRQICLCAPRGHPLAGSRERGTPGGCCDAPAFHHVRGTSETGVDLMGWTPPGGIVVPVDRCAKRGLTQIPCTSYHAGAMTLALSRSILARPNIWRLIALRRFIFPSLHPST